MEAVIEGIGEDLPPAQAGPAYALLIKIINNILKAVPGTPESAKVRTLKKESKALSETFKSPRCFDVLLVCGFEDTGSAFTLQEGDENREVLESAVQLLEALAATCEVESKSTAGSDAKATGPVHVEVPKASAPKAANGTGFQRNGQQSELEAQRKELAAVRAAHSAQHAAYPAAAASTAAAPAVGTFASQTAAQKEAEKKVKKESAFDFQSRAKKDAEVAAAGQKTDDLRALQKEKYNQFKENPTSAQQEAYKAPPSIAPGGKSADEGWFSSWFGGSGSSSGGGGGGSKPDDRDRKPKMKTINDLPKPVRRGG